MDRVRPLTANRVVGRLELRLEEALRDPGIAAVAARQLVDAEFPPTVAPDVLMAAGLDPDTILTTTGRFAVPRLRNSRSGRFRACRRRVRPPSEEWLCWDDRARGWVEEVVGAIGAAPRMVW